MPIHTHRKILAPLLALLVLVGSTSFKVNLHYCMGLVQSVSLFVEAESCGDIKKPDHNSHSESDSCQKSCCDDETIVVEGKNEKTAPIAVTLIPQKTSMVFFYISYTYLYTPTDSQTYSLKEYSPPLIEHSLPMFTQSFLL